MLPNTWLPATVADVCAFQNGYGFGPKEWDDHGLPIIRIQNLNGSANFDYFSGRPDERWLVHPGQMLFAWAGTRGVSFGPTIWRGSTGVLNQHIFKVAPRSGIDPDWLYWALRHVTERIEKSAHGFKATLLHVKKSDIERQPIALPPLAEQAAIKEVLSVWEEAISTTESLLANTRKQKKALVRRLLIHARHARASHTNWSFVDFDAVFERVTRKNPAGNTNVLTISGAQGLVSQREYFNKSVASENLTGYTLLHRGEFAYNKSYSAGYPMGAIKPQERYEAGVVSSLYICFRVCDDIEADPHFFRHYFEAGMLNEGISGIAQEGARNHGLLNVGIGDFFKLRLHIPDVDEQRRIAAVINMAERKEQLVVAQIARLHEEKRALMQKLLTGKRRVLLPQSTEEEPA